MMSQRLPLSWNGLLSAISPQPAFTRADLQRAVAAVATAQQEGRISDEQAKAAHEMLAAVAISGYVNAMVRGFFTPDERGRLGVRPLSLL